jgi:hypothetical protein
MNSTDWTLFGFYLFCFNVMCFIAVIVFFIMAGRIKIILELLKSIELRQRSINSLLQSQQPKEDEEIQ